jgi:hypothetical protein
MIRVHPTNVYSTSDFIIKITWEMTMDEQRYSVQLVLFLYCYYFLFKRMSKAYSRFKSLSSLQ